MRYFNTAGPVNCEKHYCLSPLKRIGLEEIMSLIGQEKYFVLHAPRQTGKTSCLMALMEHLNAEGEFTCLYANAEVGQASRENIEQGMKSILWEIASRAKTCLNDPFPESVYRFLLETNSFGSAINHCFTEWSSQSGKPLVILLDEIDSLVGDTLISALRQIRAGYDKRPAHFPQSVILCGVRDVRDYRIHSDRDKAMITGGSAFNIKAESLRLGDFAQSEVTLLLEQHTLETGQAFQPDAIEMIWHLSQGQPWLVNALGYELCFRMKENRDRSIPITAEMANQAKDNLILRRETHLDQLADKLREPRVRNVVEPLLTGTPEPQIIPEDDLQYVTDLGLVRRKPQVEIANPIYREIIPRMLTESVQDMLPFRTPRYVTKENTLDMGRLMAEFQQFFREHSESWVARFDYKEAGPQLLLQAFLQRVVNAGGRVDREYGLGRKRTDLLVLWNLKTGVQRIVIELKIKYGALEKTIAEGLAQTAEYMDKCGASEGHLVVFDRTADKNWDEKIFQKQERAGSKTIVVWGM